MRIPYGKTAEPVRVLDLCTGSGNIAWSLALSVPGARVVGVDISEKALEVARSQDFSSELKAAGALAPTFVAADILDTEQPFNYGQFDLILSNPPYIMEKEKPQFPTTTLSSTTRLSPDGPTDSSLPKGRASPKSTRSWATKPGMSLPG